MKKLLFALAVALMAGVSQAAALSWTITNVYAGNATDKMDGGKALLFSTAFSSAGITPKPSLTTIAAVTALLDAGDVTGAKALAAAQGTLSSAGGVAGATGVTGFTTGDTFSGFVVILSADESKYLIAQDSGGNQVISKTWSNATSAQTMAFGSQATRSQSSANWAAAAPEPTSGILMLVGLGALALRRRRA